MKRFLVTITTFFFIPICCLLCLYLWTDPFRCLHSFDITNTDNTNREYLSTELYMHNKDSILYDSFIFASSRGGGFNTYQWKQYLSTDAHPFLFQAWAETITGEYLKIKFLDETGVQIKNSILMIDIPGSFGTPQLSHKALDMKHFMFTGGTRFSYNAYQFLNFIQKPSFWKSSIQRRNIKEPYFADCISNDWYTTNRDNYTNLPQQDSLKCCSETTRKTFFAQIKGKALEDTKVSASVINQNMEHILVQIKDIFEKHNTNYAIVLSPGICYTNPAVNPFDLNKLQQIFGIENVYNYTGVNQFTIDVNNFSDPGHFGSNVGYMIIQDIYNQKGKNTK